ncbi:MAG: ABC transporter substrate-binding protein [Chloroflexi bacterium]|nr:ABC transporter substrate-binding protein [Chloroflexota bacterium]
MIIRRLLAEASSLLVLGLLLAGCAPALTPTPTLKPGVAPTNVPAGGIAPALTPKAAAPQPKYGGVLTFALPADPVTFDLHQETGGQHHLALMPAYNGLLQYDPLAWPEAKIAPDLVSGWEVSPDGLGYTFRLRSGVKWHDGVPFTSRDVKASLDRVSKPPRGMRSPRQASVSSITNVDASTADVVKIRLDQPSASLASILAIDWLAVLPQHVIEAKGDMKRDILGTGPFKLKEYAAGTSLVYVKNGDYFAPGRPYLDGIMIYVVRDESTRFAALRTGRVLYLPFPYGVSPPQAEIAKGDRNLVIQSNWEPSLVHFLMNVQRAPWSDPRVRRAASLAFDRQAFIKTAAQGSALLGAHMPSKGPWGIPEDELLKMPGYRQPKDADIAEAKRLLAEVGFPEGFSTTLLTRPESSHRARGTFALAELTKLGIKAEHVIKETAAYDDALSRGAFDTRTHGVATAIDDPDLRFGENYVTDGGRNYGKYSNPNFDDLFRRQSRALDIVERKRLVREMEMILLQDNPDVPLAWNVDNIAHSSRMRNYKMASSAYLNNKHQEVWLAD